VDRRVIRDRTRVGGSLAAVLLALLLGSCGARGGASQDDDDATADDDDDSGAADDDDATADDDDDSGAADDDDSGLPADDDDSTEPVDLTAELPVCPLGVLDAFSSSEIDPPSSGSGEYTLPSEEVLDSIQASIQALAGAEAAESVLQAAQAGYDLCRGEGTDSAVALWRPEESGTGRAVFAWRTAGARGLILEAPHPNYDMQTLVESSGLFDALQARALIGSGTHRCGSDVVSGCSGTTGACGDSAPYTISDPAHSTETVFHAAHEALSELHATDIVISVHGMAGDGVSLSNGTTDDVDSDSLVAQLATALAEAYPSDEVTSCNDFDGANNENRLCGTTNVQGRHLNGSLEPCGTAASAASGRFIHMEQELSIRQNPGPLTAVLSLLIP